MTKEELKQRVYDDFSYHSPTSSKTADLHDRVRVLLRTVAYDLIDVTPVSREQSLMLTALEEAMHWANAGIAKNQYTGE